MCVWMWANRQLLWLKWWWDQKAWGKTSAAEHHNLHTLWYFKGWGSVHVANKHVMELCALWEGCIWNLSVHNRVTWWAESDNIFSACASLIWPYSTPTGYILHCWKNTHTYTAHELAPPVCKLFKTRTCWLNLGMILNMLATVYTDLLTTYMIVDKVCTLIQSILASKCQ